MVSSTVGIEFFIFISILKDMFHNLNFIWTEFYFVIHRCLLLLLALAGSDLPVSSKVSVTKKRKSIQWTSVKERETGLEPAAPTLARSCSTN